MTTLGNAFIHGYRADGLDWRRRRVALFLVMNMLAASAFAQAQPPQHKIQPQAIEFIEAFLRRPLTAAEITQISQEEDGKDARLNEAHLALLSQLSRVLRDEDGSPGAFRYRHSIIKNMLFDPVQKKKLSAKLAFGVDPVTVLDVRQQEFMTVSDVFATVCIARFAKFGGDPDAIDKARGAQDKAAASTLADLLKKGVADGGNLPEMMINAGGFWSGLVRDWRNLSKDERDLVRRYVTDTLSGRMSSMPEGMYMRLMGWSKTDAGLDSLHKTLDRTMQIMMLQSRITMMKSLMMDSNPAWLVGPN